jgi:hypothetical protein
VQASKKNRSPENGTESRLVQPSLVCNVKLMLAEPALGSIDIPRHGLLTSAHVVRGCRRIACRAENRRVTILTVQP